MNGSDQITIAGTKCTLDEWHAALSTAKEKCECNRCSGEGTVEVFTQVCEQTYLAQMIIRGES